MSETNDTATVEQTTTEEKETNTETKETQSNDLSELKSLIESQANDIASLKRSLKKATKPEKSETPEKTKSDSSDEKYEALLLEVKQITKDSEVELARKLQKETNMPMEKLLNSKYFKTELEDLRTAEQNAEATSGVKGDKSGTGNVKQSAEYWIAKGEYPSREQVPDRETRKKIRDAMASKEKGTKGGFYNS